MITWVSAFLINLAKKNQTTPVGTNAFLFLILLNRTPLAVIFVILVKNYDLVSKTNIFVYTSMNYFWLDS